MQGEGESAVTSLAAALGCTRFFARRVVSAVQAGTEAELFKRKKRRSGVGDDVVEDLVEEEVGHALVHQVACDALFIVQAEVVAEQVIVCF